MNSLTISNWLAKAFTLAGQNYLAILKYQLLFIIFYIVAGISFVGIILLPGLVIANVKALLAIARNEPFLIKDCLKYGITNGMWWKSGLFFIVYLIGLLVGTALLVLPGLYLMSVWYLAIYVLADHNQSPFEALKQSKEIVQNIGVLKVLGYVIIVALIPFAVTFPFYSLVGYEFMGIVIDLLIIPLHTMLPLGLYLSVENSQSRVEA